MTKAQNFYNYFVYIMIRTRIAPSPTGMPHIGTIYSAFLDYVFAKKHDGKFLIRIEDTDRKRFVKGAEEALYKALDWFSLSEDESPRKNGKYGPYRQSERLDIYKKHAHKLVKKGHAYYCFCTLERLNKMRKNQQKQSKPPKYDKHCLKLKKEEAEKKIKDGKPYVVRLKVPENQTIIVNDFIRGKIKFDSNIIDDCILLKSDSFPTYHLAATVDDYLMKISHIVRGEEWLSSAPKHVLLWQYFGWQMPTIIHTPVLRAKDKSKLSKRKDHTSVSWYQSQGFLPEAILNFLALLGWSHPQEKEIFSLQEFIKHFDLKDLSPIGPVFDEEKLKWINGIYIRNKNYKELFYLIEKWSSETQSDIKKILKDKNKWSKIIPLLQPRINVLSEIKDLVDFLFKEPSFDKNQLGEEAEETLKKVIKVLKNLKKWQSQEIYKKVKDIYDKGEYKKKQFFINLYLAIEGKKAGLPVFESMEILERTETLKRLEKTLRLLEKP